MAAAAAALVGAVIFKADAEDNGETVAEVAGAVTGPSFLTVTATGRTRQRRTRTRSGSAALSPITKASSLAHIGTGALVKAFVGSVAVIGGSGLTQVLATGTNVATATSNAGGAWLRLLDQRNVAAGGDRGRRRRPSSTARSMAARA